MNDTEAFEGYRRIEYRALMTGLADFVGHHQLPIRPDASDINDILDGEPVHYELVREVVRAIYRSGRCSNLDAEVRAETVFNSLGGIRGRLIAEGDTDVDQINLLEDLGWASRALFAPALPREDDDSGDDAEDEYRPVIRQHPAG